MTAIKYAVLYPDLIQSHDRGGGARTTPMVVPSVGATTFINGITEFDPGTAIPFHSHNCEESVILLSGHAYLDIDGDVHELKPLDTTFIPPNVPHRFRNKSDVEPMKILWIYASVNATRTLMESGETRAVAAEHAK
ncbi:cupin domain-containing protein [bacterium M00.F.Ca.ET.228.01.1.1]|uniref:Cupin domain-containing protein n=1 Tax=Burkholderia cenocepacia TaxID=95486 RepID=A0AAW4TIS6_9BURK|nr:MULTISPECIES: cupin domain-containing protein [Burkholderia cepacia complex]TGP40194.1 cupin domain-containing protein [bacterium M00.F.Ca.ET.228.01.1.1]TGR96424.1 cupin domain-containing protein [bacterium M00.F.Ca.ET.191.01.1.1]TGT97660.1 cupin domain-containing protein [bacterium M00.F.Ca.ET.155.01.1.1]MCA8383112.1 cupin domain-containing protein [Burkholderia cenocepacia]MEB2607231.1 cupin domain-containing protein [Burkholderia cenocepacia]